MVNEQQNIQLPHWLRLEPEVGQKLFQPSTLMVKTIKGTFFSRVTELFPGDKLLTINSYNQGMLEWKYDYRSGATNIKSSKYANICSCVSSPFPPPYYNRVSLSFDKIYVSVLGNYSTCYICHAISNGD